MIRTIFLTVLLSATAGAGSAASRDYVALGSSYAAGFGLGAPVAGAPPVCARGDRGYPHQIARDLGLSLVDASCSGATVTQLLEGGQADLPPQLAAIGPETKLVTFTAGGNDVAYIGDIGRAASGKAETLSSVDQRPFARLAEQMRETFREIRTRAPSARIIVVTYPALVPARGSCDAIRLTPDQAALFRRIADRLADVTRQTARNAGGIVVDMAALSAGHDACSAQPWTNGAHPASGAPFHPNLAGATATAKAVERALSEH